MNTNGNSHDDRREAQDEHEDERARQEHAERRGALLLRERHAGLSLAYAAGLTDEGIDPGAAARYVQDLLARTLQTDDPVERMIVEQLGLLHHQIIQLHRRAAGQHQARGGQDLPEYGCPVDRGDAAAEPVASDVPEPRAEDVHGSSATERCHQSKRPFQRVRRIAGPRRRGREHDHHGPDEGRGGRRCRRTHR